MPAVFSSPSEPIPFEQSCNSPAVQGRLDAVLVNVFIEKIMTNDLLMDSILNMCTPATAIRFSQTCREAQLVLRSYMSRAYRLERNLSRFFSDPLEFRRLQARTATLLSGSAALQFFDRSFWPESDLDVYVQLRFAKDVGHYLLQEGYAFIPGQIQAEDFETAWMAPMADEHSNPYAFRGVASVFTFQKETADDMLKVQLIASRRSCVEVILNFHSTCVMNVISFEKAYCLYPKATLEERRSLICATEGPAQGVAIEKYTRRGWKMLDRDLDWAQDLRSSFRIVHHLVRYMGDRYCWTIPLDVANIPDRLHLDEGCPRLIHDPASASSWSLDYRKGCGAAMDFKVMEDRNLCLPYITTYGDMLHKLTRITTEIPVGWGLMQSILDSYDEEYMAMCEMSYKFNDGMQDLLGKA